MLFVTTLALSQTKRYTGHMA